MKDPHRSLARWGAADACPVAPLLEMDCSPEQNSRSNRCQQLQTSFGGDRLLACKRGHGLRSFLEGLTATLATASSSFLHPRGYTAYSSTALSLETRI